MQYGLVYDPIQDNLVHNFATLCVSLNGIIKAKDAIEDLTFTLLGIQIGIYMI